MKRYITLFAGMVILAMSCTGNSEVASLRNGSVKIDFDLRTGYYKIFDMKDKTLCIDSAGVTKWLSEEIAGIKPPEPGFKSFIVRDFRLVSKVCPRPQEEERRINSKHLKLQ